MHQHSIQVYGLGLGNASLEGYFHGARGMRQGDPLLTKLFVSAMECFSRILHHYIGTGPFPYHPNCKDLCIYTSILLMICMLFVILMKFLLDHHKALLGYHAYSATQLNKSTTELIWPGSHSQMIWSFVPCWHSNYGVWTLPVRYHGSPHIFKAHNCTLFL